MVLMIFLTLNNFWMFHSMCMPPRLTLYHDFYRSQFFFLICSSSHAYKIRSEAELFLIMFTAILMLLETGYWSGTSIILNILDILLLKNKCTFQTYHMNDPVSFLSDAMYVYFS